MAQVMQSARFTLAALEAVGEHQPVGVADLARLLDRPKSTTQRALATLAEAGWIRADGSVPTRWILTGRVLSVARHFANQGELRDAARIHLEALRAATGESVTLAVRDGDQVVTVEFLEGAHSIRYVAPIGARVPLFVGATGKVVLAHLPDRVQRDVLAGADRDPAPLARMDAPELAAELATIRARGFAISHGELSHEVTVVAAPLLVGGTAVAAIAVAAPKARLTDDDRVAEVVRLVVDAADRVMAETRAGAGHHRSDR